jgi:hypothetical protein
MSRMFGLAFFLLLIGRLPEKSPECPIRSFSENLSACVAPFNPLEKMIHIPDDTVNDEVTQVIGKKVVGDTGITAFF